jgi:hypothetical protein
VAGRQSLVLPQYEGGLKYGQRQLLAREGTPSYRSDRATSPSPLHFVLQRNYCLSDSV